MKVLSKLAGQEDYQVVVDFDKSLDGKPVLTEENNVETPVGYALDRKFITEDMCVSYFKVNFKDDFHSDFFTGDNIVAMFFVLEGKIVNVYEDQEATYTINEGTHNILYWPLQEGRANFSKGEETRALSIYLTKKFFMKCISKENDIFEDALTKISNKEYWRFDPKNHFITDEMNAIIQQVIETKREGVFLKLFLEAKIKELLLLQIESSNEDTVAQTLSPSLKIAESVHKIIKENTYGKFTLKEIAAQLGTNVSTLKNAFKSHYDVSVFQYWNSLKFKESKRLLLKNYSVKEVSIILGYKNPQHFSSAFKKHFLITPTEFLDAK